MRKRGSHIGVIVSFMVFISLIVFLYAIIQPKIANQQDKTVLINTIKNDIIQNMTGGNYTQVIVRVYEEKTQKNCVQLKDFFSSTGTGPRAILVNSSGTLISLYKDSSNPNDLFLNASPLNFTIYYSPDFPNLSQTTLGSSCTPLTQTPSQNYYSVVGVNNISTRNYISRPSVINLVKNYDQDYLGIQKQFNLTLIQNFGFNFTYQDGTSTGTSDRAPTGVNIYSQEFPIVYYGESGNLEEGKLTVRVW
jgi:hypothetical protein